MLVIKRSKDAELKGDQSGGEDAVASIENYMMTSDQGVSNLICSDSMGNAGETGDPVEREEKVVDENVNR